MPKLIAGLFLTLVLPTLVNAADMPDSSQSPQSQPSGTEAPPVSKEPEGGEANTQNEAYDICVRATQLFEQQEKDKKQVEAPITPLSNSCKTELKPAKYWLCMEKEAKEQVDFNTAHWRCVKKLHH